MTTTSLVIRPLSGGGTPLRSDTLFGALCWTLWAARGSSAIEYLLEERASPPAFALGDACPVVGKTVFWPMPVLAFPPAPPDAKTQRELPKARWLAEDLFRDCLAGRHTGKTLAELARNDKLVVRNGFVARNEITEDAVTEQLFWRNSGDRLTGGAREGELFSVPVTYYGRDVRLHIPYWVAENYRAEFHGLFRLLGDTGVGADRAVGMGHFEVVEPARSFDFDVRAPNATVTLGRLMPGNGQFNFCNEPLSYHLDLVRPVRESWFVRDRREKPTMRFFTPGSILPGAPRGPWAGRMIPLEDDAMPKAAHCGIAAVLPACVSLEDP